MESCAEFSFHYNTLNKMNMKLLIVITIAILAQLLDATSNSDGSCELNQSDDRADKDSLLNTLTYVLKERQKCLCDLKSIRDKLRNMVLTDCSSHYEAGSRENGIYQISPDGITVFNAYCNMDQVGWTVIQRRVDASVDFDRTWDEYVKGFGDLNTNFWLGLDKIYLLTRKPNQIFFNLTMFDTGKTATALYPDFYIGNKTTIFVMHVSPSAVYNNEMQKYIGRLNGFYYHNGMQFSTMDADHDKSGENCAVGGGGWWHNACHQIGYFNAPDYRMMRISNSTHHPRVLESEIMIGRQN